jgi:hypothetical protein
MLEHCNLSRLQIAKKDPITSTMIIAAISTMTAGNKWHHNFCLQEFQLKLFLLTINNDL